MSEGKGIGIDAVALWDQIVDIVYGQNWQAGALLAQCQPYYDTAAGWQLCAKPDADVDAARVIADATIRQDLTQLMFYAMDVERWQQERKKHDTC